jgi:hypothetical protein
MAMTWITQNKRAWRAALLALLVVAFLGPWTFDLIHVPAQFECSPPFIRLEGDFCGQSQPGLRMAVWLAGGLASIVGRLLGGEMSAVRELLIVAVLLAPFVPVALSLAALWRGSGRESRWLLPFWILGMLAVIIYLSFLAAAGSEIVFSYLRHVWGAWLYAILAAAMAASEGAALVAGRAAANAQR